jgi:uncharacterized OB-fold protein
VTVRVVPPASERSAPFWDATRARRLVQRRCRDCGAWAQFAIGLCPRCRSADFEWQPVSGRGVVHTFTVVRAAAPSLEWAARTPYVVALVELEEGPRLMTNIVGSDPETVAVGAAVRVGWEPLENGRAYPVFELVP